MPCSCANSRPIDGLPLVGLLAGEDEVVVGDRDLARVDRVAAGDLVEGVDRERRRAVGGRQQVGVDAQRRAGPHLGVLVDAVRPHDLLGRRQAPRGRGVRPHDRAARARPSARNSRRPTAKMPPRAADLVLLGRERHRVVGLAARLVRRAGACAGSNAKRVAVLRVGHRLRALHDVQAEVEGVAAEDVAHVVAAHDHHLEPDLLGHALRARPGSSRATSRSRSGRRRSRTSRRDARARGSRASGSGTSPPSSARRASRGSRRRSRPRA